MTHEYGSTKYTSTYPVPEGEETKWEHWVPNEDDPSWYDDGPGAYLGSPDPLQLQAAKKFVQNWREIDNHGLKIPNTPWGLSLMHWVRVLIVAADRSIALQKKIDRAPHDYANCRLYDSAGYRSVQLKPSDCTCWKSK